MKERAYFNWSSGKDAALALYQVMKGNLYDVITLFTVLYMDGQTIPMHETSLHLLQQQAESIGIPLTVFQYHTKDSPGQYQSNMQKVMESFQSQKITTAIFGDINLEELRKQREKNCLQSNIKAVFPLWNLSAKEVLKQFVSLGFQAVITCVDGSKLNEKLIGRVIDDTLINELPPDADPCGENGEYHSFVFDGPIFRWPVRYEIDHIFYKDYPLQSNAASSQQLQRFWYAAMK